MVRRSQVVYDAFTGSGALADHTPDVAPAGASWAVLNGSFANLSGGVLPYTSGNYGVALLNSGLADCEVQAVCRADHSGLVVRSNADATNRIVFYPYSTTGIVQIRRCTALAESGIVYQSADAGFPTTVGTDYTLTIYCHNELVRCFIDGVNCADYWDATYTTNTYQGVGGIFGGNAWDNYSVRAERRWKTQLVFGDSISYHTEAENAVLDFCESQNAKWATRLAPSRNRGRMWSRSRAINGAGICNGATRLSDEIATAIAAGDEADVILCALGTNDPPATAGITAEYQSCLQSIAAAWPGVPIYCMGVFGTTGAWNYGTAENAATMDAKIRAAAMAEGATFVETYGWIDPATDTSDGLHPNAAGNIKIAAGMLAELGA